MTFPNISKSVTLIGPDTASLAQDEFSASAEIALTSGETITGAVITAVLRAVTAVTMLTDLAFEMYLFSSDPSVSHGDTALTDAQRAKLLGRVSFPNSKLETDSNGGEMMVADQRVGFAGPLSSIWACVKTKGATALNSATGDDEQIDLDLVVERRS